MSDQVQAERPAPHALASFVCQHIESGHWPSAGWAVATADAGLVTGGVAGYRSVEPRRLEAGPDTLYDLASVTKGLFTATVACRLADAGALDPAQPLDELLPEMRGYAGATPSLASLLTHTAGLKAWVPLYCLVRRSDDAVAAIASLEPDRPAGVAAVYSCLGPILAGVVLERATGLGLRALLEQQIRAPLGLDASDIAFGPLTAALRERVAATERGRSRESELAATVLGPDAADPSDAGTDPLVGEVHDGNAAFLGGAAGNAGLFATAEAVAEAGVALLSGALLSARERARLRECVALGDGEARTFGFQSGRAAGAPGRGLGERSFGHVGFTGTCLWLDPERGAAAVLLTNRVHPRWTEAPMDRWRADFLGLAARVVAESGR